MDAVQSKVVTLKDGRTRRFRSKQERRQIVEETMKPGASVAAIARAHDTNANQVFKWRKQYQAGRLDDAGSNLLPVRISNEVHKLRPRAHQESKATTPGIIDIDLGHARIRIEGAADPECVRAALEGLNR